MKERSVDEWHEMWLEEMSCFTWNYMTKNSSSSSANAKGYVMSDPADDFSFKCDGQIELPPGSGKLIQKMAGFSQATLYKPSVIKGTDLKDFPTDTFCLHSLLLAAFPKNVNTNVFRANDCAVSVACLPSPKGGFRAEYVAFGGLGVILMAECRRLLSPLAPDQDVLDLVDERFLSIVE